MPSNRSSRSVGGISGLALLAVLVPSCGLTLDYDPPMDTGARLDAPPFDAGERRDAGTADASALDAGPPCGGCPSDRACFEGECRLRCTGTACSDDPTTCEACVDGLCMPAEPTCAGGSACAIAACDPATDQCTTSSTCGPGLSCSIEGCVPGECTGDPECTALLDGCAEPFLCGTSGVCEPRDRGVCPAISGSCAVVDACTCLPTDAIDPALCGGLFCDPATANCVECLETADCAAGQVCHPTRHECHECVENGDCAAGVCDPTTFSCVECFDITHCPDFGTTLCDPSTRSCVECLGNTDCTSPGEPYCIGGACAACLSSADCEPSRPVCGADGACGPCSVDTECGPGMRCAMGACVLRGCLGDADCPGRGCIHGTCSGGTCSYAIDDGFCGPGGPGDDFVACTRDACDTSAGTPDLCVHRADDARCPDDGFSCTQERCNALAIGGGGALGCTRVRNDAACAPSGSLLECAIGVCVGGEPGAIVQAGTGCGLAYEPRRCGVGSVCSITGQCDTAPTCSATRVCPNDGTTCNGVLECRLGMCFSVDPGLTVCGAAASCATYCSTSGCALRTDPPRDALCSIVVTP